MSALSVYPAELEADVALRDGSVAHVRPIRTEDEPCLLAFLGELSEDDRRMRFFGLSNDLSRTAHDEADVDYVHSLGLLATVGSPERIVGHALYASAGDGRAEVAFAISADYQGRGLATILLGQLADAAAANGIETFEALVLPENRRMLEVLRESGFPVKTRYEWNSIEATFPTLLTPQALARFEQREELASASALRRVLYPRSVAVVGASQKPGAVGAAVVRNLLGAAFPGPIYPVNPAGGTIQSLPAYASLEDIPGPVDLAIVAVPSKHVIGVAEQCGRKGVHSLIVLTAGFAEVGLEGQYLQSELLRICRSYGMRLIGPNCIGAINTDPAAPLNATFGPLMPLPGRIGMATQSGALGLAAIDFTAARGLGFSSLVSMGNKADISGNDLLGYWHTDPQTDVILLYLESFGNPRKFSHFARAISRSKPIVALKSGRSAVGARATASHTGALLSASDVTVDALFRQAGVIRTDTLDEMLDVADLLVHQPLPAGRRVAILTNVGGPAVMCADTCEAHGLELPPLSEATQARLRELLPAEASVANPVDMLAPATPEQYEQAVRALAEDPNIDAVISIFLTPLATQPEDVARAVSAAILGLTAPKPVLAVFMSSQPLPLLNTPGGGRVPGYHTPEPAAIALGHVVRYAEWRSRPIEDPPTLTRIDKDEAGSLLAKALHRGAGWLTPDEVRRLLGMYGVSVVDQRLVATAAEAADAAAELGGVVALKAIAPGLLHKSDVGGVRLGLAGPQAVVAAAHDMAAAVHEATGTQPTGFLVQPMAAPGVEMLVGVVNDPQFGPTVACGAGGTLVELLKDISVRLSPVTRSDAASMLRELRSFPLLEGYRGAPGCDADALEDVLLRISALAQDHEQIAEMDCNPVMVSASGAVVVDARVRVAPAGPRRPLGARR
ncbi:MAG: GNAT family N-acetyltransferase [Chloroflexota bacterium]|nr:GNAT family N-acetyltransferase [Chloroflexota bacterium]